jgi:hypothetical protein
MKKDAKQVVKDLVIMMTADIKEYQEVIDDDIADVKKYPGLAPHHYFTAVEMKKRLLEYRDYLVLNYLYDDETEDDKEYVIKVSVKDKIILCEEKL